MIQSNKFIVNLTLLLKQIYQLRYDEEFILEKFDLFRGFFSQE